MIRDKPMSSKRSPDRAVTEIGVSCSDSTFFRAVTTTSSRLALTPVGNAAIAARHIVPIILRLHADAGANPNGLHLGDVTEWENIRSNFVIR